MNMDPDLFADADVFIPSRILMNAEDFCDILAWGLVEDGWTEEEARAEARRRLEALDQDIVEIGELMGSLR